MMNFNVMGKPLPPTALFIIVENQRRFIEVSTCSFRDKGKVLSYLTKHMPCMAITSLLDIIKSFSCTQIYTQKRKHSAKRQNAKSFYKTFLHPK